MTRSNSCAQVTAHKTPPKTSASSCSTIWNSTRVTWRLIPLLKSIQMTFLKAGWLDLTLQHEGRGGGGHVCLVNTHITRKEGPWRLFCIWGSVSLSRFLPLQLTAGYWHMTREGMKTEQEDGALRSELPAITRIKGRFPFVPKFSCPLQPYLTSGPTPYPALSVTNLCGRPLGSLHIWAPHLAVFVYAQVSASIILAIILAMGFNHPRNLNAFSLPNNR